MGELELCPVSHHAAHPCKRAAMMDAQPDKDGHDFPRLRVLRREGLASGSSRMLCARSAGSMNITERAYEAGGVVVPVGAMVTTLGQNTASL